jgi:ABC transport system ATP-binding/permease protein
MTILLDAERVTASRPNRPLFTDLSFTLNDGDRIGVVGINGCGKSTLLRILAADIEPESGVVRRGRGMRLGFLGQSPSLPVTTVREAAGGTWQSDALLDRLGMGPMMDARTDRLSGGQAKRVALSRLLAGEYEALILDEPTNHLDLDAISFLEEWLAAYTGGLILVTHDRHVLDRVTTKVLEIDRGRGYLHVPGGITAGSGYAAYLAARIEREEQAITNEQARRNLARRELAWLRRGAPARTRKPKARIDSATALVNARPQAAARSGELGLSLGTARLGSKAVELHDVSFRWPDADSDVLTPFSHLLEPGDRLGIVGANGSGKSTLLDLIAGRHEPRTGRIERGTTVVIGYYDQLGRTLDVNQRVRDAVAGPNKTEPTIDDKKLMERFWFDGDAQFAPIHTLSGGERRRLQLLLTLIDQPNVLLLDEPTNDLDLDTLRALEDFLEDWPGALVVVSHDRAFIDRTVEDVLALDGSGRAGLVRGGVEGWLAMRAAAATSGTGAASAKPSTNRPAPVAASGGGASQAKPTASRSPSTIKRQIAEAERAMATATSKRDTLTASLATVTDHTELSRIGDELHTVQDALDAAEARWLDLAAEAEALGLAL